MRSDFRMQIFGSLQVGQQLTDTVMHKSTLSNYYLLHYDNNPFAALQPNESYR